MPLIALQPANAPQDTVFPPASAQAMLNFVAAYLQVSGLEALDGVIISENEPMAPDRDKAWVKLDPGIGRALGLFIYNGGWQQVPIILASGSTPPSAAKVGELYFDTSTNAVLVFNGEGWSTNLWPSGPTENRPEEPAIGASYFDTTINRLLRFASQGWTTLDGGVGDIKLTDFADEDAALTANPGWSVFEPLRGKFPVGAGDDTPAKSDGGVPLSDMELKWAAKRRSASGGTREASATFIGELTLNGVAKTADGTKADALSEIGSETTINFTPPYRSVIFLRKDF